MTVNYEFSGLMSGQVNANGIMAIENSANEKALNTAASYSGVGHLEVSVFNLSNELVKKATLKSKDVRLQQNIISIGTETASAEGVIELDSSDSGTSSIILKKTAKASGASLVGRVEIEVSGKYDLSYLLCSAFGSISLPAGEVLFGSQFSGSGHLKMSFPIYEVAGD